MFLLKGVACTIGHRGLLFESAVITALDGFLVLQLTAAIFLLIGQPK
jgi:hypothetical protein